MYKQSREKHYLRKILFFFSSALLLSLLLYAGSVESAGFYERPGISATEIFRQRGYLARDVYLTSKDGYQIKVVHATNPLIKKKNNRRPIVFFHGILEEGSVFVINSFDVKPKDFSSLDLFNSSIESLILEDPSSKSLPLLALNFGHDVWLVNRRGAPGSQRKISTLRSEENFPNDDDYFQQEQEQEQQQQEQEGELISTRQFDFPIFGNSKNHLESSNNWFLTLGALTSAFGALFDYGKLLQLFPFSFDRDFWNYSLDEQVEFDFPMIVNYISEQSGGQKVAVVAHSAGGSITLMSLADQPEIANKISSAILWSEGFSLGFGEVFEIFQAALPVFETYIGSVPPAFSSTQIQALLGLICATDVAQSTLCELILDLVAGASGGMEPLKPEFLNSVFYSTSSHELAQNLQCVRYGGTMHHYNYGSIDINMAKYKQAEPPIYDLTQVKLDRISFYVGRTDFIVSEKDVRYSASMLVDTTFNHQGYFYHDNTAKLAIVPSLKDIHRFSKID